MKQDDRSWGRWNAHGLIKQYTFSVETYAVVISHMNSNTQAVCLEILSIVSFIYTSILPPCSCALGASKYFHTIQVSWIMFLISIILRVRVRVSRTQLGIVLSLDCLNCLRWTFVIPRNWICAQLGGIFISFNILILDKFKESKFTTRMSSLSAYWMQVPCPKLHQDCGQVNPGNLCSWELWPECIYIYIC